MRRHTQAHDTSTHTCAHVCILLRHTLRTWAHVCAQTHIHANAAFQGESLNIHRLRFNKIFSVLLFSPF